MPKRKASASSQQAAEAVPEATVAKRARKVTEDDAAFTPQAVSHASHLKVPGDIFMLGSGDCGQFGLGEDVVEAPRPLPTALPDNKAVQLAAGGMHTLALAEDGSVWSTGVNDEGALGRRTDGQAWKESNEQNGAELGDQNVWGRVTFPAAAQRIVQVSAGDSHSCALDEHGTVYCWGTFRGESGVFGFAPGTRIALTPTAVLQASSAAEQVVKIASGADHCLALRSDGSVFSWGVGLVGQLGRIGTRMHDPEGLQLTPAAVPIKRTRPLKASSKIVEVACGIFSSFAVTDDGHVLSWGLNNYGQLGYASKTPAYTPKLVKGLDGQHIVDVRAGEHHSFARSQDGKLLSFGRPTYGRLGRKDADVKSDAACPEPKPVDGLDTQPVHSMSAGLAVSACVAGEGHDAYLWGFGTNGQLGKGDDDEDELIPLKLKETKRYQNRRVLQMEVGGQHVALLTISRS